MESDAAQVADDRLGRVQSLVRAFSLLNVLGGHEAGLTLTEILRETKLARSTAHRLLSTMGDLGYVQFDQRRNLWSIGVKAFEVGNAFAQTRDFAGLGRPIMRLLMSDADETVNIAVPRGLNIYYVGQVQAAGAAPTRARPGVHLPIHTSAAGKAIMAYWSQEEFAHFLETQQLERPTTRSITDPRLLAEHLRAVHQRGYALDDQENASGMRCIAAPVFDEHGYPTAALSISGPISRLNDCRVGQLACSLTAAAQRMTTRIGGRMAA